VLTGGCAASEPSGKICKREAPVELPPVPVAGPATLARRVALISAGDLPGLNGVIERDDFPLRFRRQP